MNSILVALTLAAPAAIHVRVDGEGYFRFARGTQGVYATEGNLTNLNGLICNADGYPLLPQTRLAPGAPFSVQMDGSIASAGKSIGRIVLAVFAEGSMVKSGKYLLATTRSQIGFPGDGVLGIVKGFSAGASLPVSAQQSIPKTTAIPTVEVSLKSEIDKPEISVGDVATIEGPKALQDQIASVDLGATPIFGAQRGITRGYIVAAMRHAGIDTDKITILCPAGAFALRKGQQITPDSLIDAAKDGIAKQFGTNEEVRCDRMIPEFYVPSGQITFTTVQAIQVGDGYTVNLEVDVDGKMVARRTIGLVPTTPAQRIQSGQPVKIRVLKNGASVEVEGKTRASGKIGSTIAVESEAGATFTGTLVSASLVEVKL